MIPRRERGERPDPGAGGALCAPGERYVPFGGTPAPRAGRDPRASGPRAGARPARATPAPGPALGGPGQSPRTARGRAPPPRPAQAQARPGARRHPVRQGRAAPYGQGADRPVRHGAGRGAPWGRPRAGPPPHDPPPREPSRARSEPGQPTGRPPSGAATRTRGLGGSWRSWRSRATGPPGHRATGSPGHRVTGSPGHRVTGSPGHRVTGSPGHRATGRVSRCGDRHRPAQQRCGAALSRGGRPQGPTRCRRGLPSVRTGRGSPCRPRPAPRPRSPPSRRSCARRPR